MSTTIDLRELPDGFRIVVERARIEGEVIVTDGGVPCATLVSVDRPLARVATAQAEWPKPAPLESEAFPVRKEATGAWRVGRCNVLLEMVIHEHRAGVPPEVIVEEFDTLDLADVYAVIAYAIRHPDEIDAYLARREQQAQEIRQKIEATQGDLSDVRRRLAAVRLGTAPCSES